MDIINLIGDCILKVVETCVDCCQLYDKEKGKTSIYDKTSPMVINRQSFIQNSTPTCDQKSKIEEKQTNLLNFSEKELLLKEKQTPKIYDYDEYKSYAYFTISVEIIHDSTLNTLAVKVIPNENMPKKFDVILNNDGNIQKHVKCYKKTSKFVKISENDLEKAILSIKFYQSKSINIGDLSEIKYELNSLLNVAIKDKQRFCRTDLNLFQKNSKSLKGSVEIGLQFDENNKELIVYVYDGKDLVNDSEKQFNPFCLIQLFKEKSQIMSFKTTVQPDTKDPVWNEIFKFPILYKELSKDVQLEIRVFNNTDSVKLPIGNLTFPTMELSFETNHWNQIITKPNEEIKMRHDFK